MNRPKTGPAKVYTDAEIAGFAEFREQRARLSPGECDQGELCWVAAGPPAITPGGRCMSCGGVPKMKMMRVGGRARWRKR